MAKIKINGELIDFDKSSKPVAEMMALEKALKTTYGQWEQDLQGGSAGGVAGFVWLAWRRDGRDIEFADIESGEVEINIADCEFDLDDGERAPDPTTSPAAKGASRGTGTSTSRRSAS